MSTYPTSTSSSSSTSTRTRRSEDLGDEILMSDSFGQDLPAGTVVGSTGADGAVRRGRDVEGLMAVDNGALRIRPLTRPGWGREGIAYGPFDREPGLAFAAHVLNGHNSSQTFYDPETTRQRIRRIISGARRGKFVRPHHYENLAVGFVPSETPKNPLADAHSFVMHAACGDNGELWVSHRSKPSRVALGLLNVPFVYVVVLRQDGAAFYTSSVEGATGAAAYPALRPMGIDVNPVDGPLYAEVQQRILGEVGYRVDTRVYGTKVARISAWSSWYGTAHAADRMMGSGLLDHTETETGQTWSAMEGQGVLERSAGGARPVNGETAGAAQLDTGERAGLVHARTTLAGRSGSVELWWRVDARSALIARVTTAGTSIVSRDLDGCDLLIADDPTIKLTEGEPQTLSVLDDGTTVAVHVDGRLVGDEWWNVGDRPDPTSGAVAVIVNGHVTIRDLEAHPREIPMAEALDCGTPWAPDPSVPHFEERFDAVAEDLHSTSTPSGGREWARDVGIGRIELLGAGARVRADRANPNPDRTIFTVDWDHPDYAELGLDMTLPGTARGEGHDGRCGVLFWQDPDNYLVVNLFQDDAFDGTSVSTFYHLGGHEDMYDAVWTLVPGVAFGKRCQVKAAFDGSRFEATINGEPALTRALTDIYPNTPDLTINRVGIVVNREWGDDTGTLLHSFTARRRS